MPPVSSTPSFVCIAVVSVQPNREFRHFASSLVRKVFFISSPLFKSCVTRLHFSNSKVLN